MEALKLNNPDVCLLTLQSTFQRAPHITPLGASGITTFLAMAYILLVNSGMLSLVIPGKRKKLVCATALASFLGCWLMGILSTTPSCLHQVGDQIHLSNFWVKTEDDLGSQVGDVDVVTHVQAF